MTTPRQCPQCGAQIPADAPEGVCPKCLIAHGFRDPSTVPTGSYSGFVAPSPEQLAEHFPQLEIVELLGKGGMGAVYKARQPELDRYVALKILPPEVGKDPAFAERFTREARALAKLNHSSIVAVHEFGEADGLYYFVMEFVDGANLRQALDGGGLTPAEALAIVPQICEALQFAHDEGVVHRDIKPENILIDKRGRVKIADFGLAKLLGVDAEESRAEKPFTLTGSHQVMGTPHYMAPEQVQGSSAVDHRADIYSLGVVFYEMLTGELPIGRFTPPSNKVRIDVRLDDVVLRTLESTPERRYQHASEVKTEVESIAGSGDARFQAPQPVAEGFAESVRGRLKTPAMGLRIASIVNLAATLTFMVLMGFWGPSVAQIVIASCSLGLGIVLLVGSTRMRDLQSYPIALTAALAALLPLAPGFVVSLPLGVWALLVLLRPDVKSAFAGQWEFRHAAEGSAASAVFVRARLKTPAIGLRVASAVNLLAPVVIGVMMVTTDFDAEQPLIALCSLVLGIVLLLGAARMRDLESYPLALAAAIAALLPLVPGFLISLPFGIWALTLLSRRDVRKAFAGESADERKAREPESAIGGMIVLGFSVGAGLGVLMDNMGVYLSLGIALGCVAGAGIDALKRREPKD